MTTVLTPPKSPAAPASSDNIAGGAGSPNEGKRILVAVRPAANGAEVSVTDQGPGIPPEERKRIFHRFVRGKAATGKQVRGSGIGLSLVKHIAEAHGGSIRVSDAAPHGSVFTLRLTRRA